MKKVLSEPFKVGRNAQEMLTRFVVLDLMVESQDCVCATTLDDYSPGFKFQDIGPTDHRGVMTSTTIDRFNGKSKISIFVKREGAHWYAVFGCIELNVGSGHPRFRYFRFLHINSLINGTKKGPWINEIKEFPSEEIPNLIEQLRLDFRRNHSNSTFPDFPIIALQSIEKTWRIE